MNRNPGTARPDEGSIFIETLVALALLAMVLAGLYRVVADSAARRQQVEARRNALMVARSALATVGYATPYAVGATDGADGAQRWRIEMQPCGSAPRSAGILYCVTVSVQDAAGGSPLVRLSTRRLAPGV